MRKTKDTDLQWAVPPKLKIPPDPLELRIDFHSQAVVMYTYRGEITTRKIISAMDLVHTLAKQLSFSSGILPKNCLWWTNASGGPQYAMYEEPKVRKLAIQYDVSQPPKRYTIPLPGMLFLCSPGQAPRVFAVKHRPSRQSDIIYSAPMLNTQRNGISCAGSNRYPDDVSKIPESYFLSFFTAHGDIQDRSKKYKQNIIRLWEELDKNKTKEYPLDDLVSVGKVGDLIKEKNGSDLY